jgi:hypothetical protein
MIKNSKNTIMTILTFPLVALNIMIYQIMLFINKKKK